MIAGVLIFGKDLPGMMRKLGTAAMEFRKGLSEIGSESAGKMSESKLFSTGRRAGNFEASADGSDDIAFSDSKFVPPA
jgi:Sec-independent protein translocase protein TatA